MIERLTALLERREADCAVRAMLWGEDSHEDYCEVENDSGPDEDSMLG
jgi:hypothetical protein